MDLLQGVQDAIGDKPADAGDLPVRNADFKMPPLEEMLKIVEKMDISDENKQQLRENLLSKANMDKIEDFLPNAAEETVAALKSNSSHDIMLLLLLIAAVALIFVFFGYKLYRSHADRERKREEKRRMKQQKKKK